MNVVILAGGLGTRLAEETSIKPKPMVEVGGHPLLWHIMKHYRHHGHRDFYVALGYLGEVVKRYFLEYRALQGSVAIDLASGNVQHGDAPIEDWLVNLVDTGQATNTGGRLLRLRDRLGKETFLATYGDGVANVDIADLISTHKRLGRIATITAVRPPARFGGLLFDGDLVSEFTEKPQTGEGWINGGYFVFEPALFDYLVDDDTNMESVALTRLAQDGQLASYRHEGFWQCMDTLRDKRLLERLWHEPDPPWKVWG